MKTVLLIGVLSLVVASCNGEATVNESLNSMNTANNANSASCGDGILDDGEACDGQELAGRSCESEGFTGGTATCTSACSLDLSACETEVAVCGDGIKNGDELCDTNDLAQTTCADVGFESGVLSCIDCRFDVTQCSGGGPVCSDGVAVGAEVCDGTDVANETCATQGFSGGTLGCNADCQGFDSAMCTTCGDSLVEGDEACDGAAPAGRTCTDEGFDGGMLGCTAGCEIDLSACTRETCGNGVIDMGEDCEPDVAFTTTCDQAGNFDGGALSCAANCRWQTSACTRCGDGVIAGDEVCDMAALGGATCETQPNADFNGGNLACNTTCTGYVTTGCFECGNGVREGAEQCDGNDLDGAMCSTIGFSGGVLTCGATCQYQSSACFRCGDGAIDAGEQCDGANLNGMTCVDIDPAKPAGNLACGSTCQFDNTMCGVANDADMDGVVDASDPAPNDLSICGDSDLDGCDDCSVMGMSTPSNDGYDPDGDGQCELALDYACMNGANAATDAYRLESCIMFTHVNNDRALFTAESGNAAPVVWNEDIWAVAKAHSVDMCNTGTFAHTNAAGMSPQDRANAANLGFSISENIAVNLDPGAAQYAFMEEPTCRGHRGNILSPRGIELGIGYHKCNSADQNYMWRTHDHVTQNFRLDFSQSESAFCQSAATDCEIPPNPPTTATCPANLISFGFCPVPSATTLNGWGCPSD